jgi:hypothetical protein
MNLTYEQIATPLDRGGEPNRRIADFVGGDAPETFESRHEKVTGPLSKIVANYDELVEACEISGLSLE